jgi:hypothetical protein
VSERIVALSAVKVENAVLIHMKTLFLSSKINFDVKNLLLFKCLLGLKDIFTIYFMKQHCAHTTVLLFYVTVNDQNDDMINLLIIKLYSAVDKSVMYNYILVA